MKAITHTCNSLIVTPPQLSKAIKGERKTLYLSLNSTTMLPATGGMVALFCINNN